MFAVALALTLAFAPPEPAPEIGEVEASSEVPADEGAPETADSPEIAPADIHAGTIVLAPLELGEYQLYTSDGRAVGGPLQLGAGKAPKLQLPAGVYHLRGPTGVDAIVVAPGSELAWDGERVIPVDIWRAELAEQAVQAELAAAAALEAQQRPADPVRRGRWRVWASPIASTLIPGLGQFFNGQGGKGTGILFGTVASAAGAGALYSLSNDGTRKNGAEYARLIGYGTLSTAAGMLWVYGIADAYRVASGKQVAPALDHRVRLSVNRMMTVGSRADVTRPGFYDDWSVSIMGQAARRLSVGVSDLSVKPGGFEGPQVWQFGARLDYRVFDRRKLWIDVGVGSIFQVAVGQLHDPLDPELGVPGTRSKFGAAPYGLLDLRVFVLDHLSLDFVPRLVVPVSTRYYSANRALPRFAPELELGAGLSVYF